MGGSRFSAEGPCRSAKTSNTAPVAGSLVAPLWEEFINPVAAVVLARTSDRQALSA